MDQQVSPEPENGQSPEEEEETSDLENGSKGETAKLCSPPAKLFAFSIVNSYGTANISPLPCDGNVLKLNREGCFSFALRSLFKPLKPPVDAASLVSLFLQHIPRWQSTGTPSQRNCAMTNRKQRSVLSSQGWVLICKQAALGFSLILCRPTRSTRACCSHRRRKPRLL